MTPRRRFDLPGILAASPQAALETYAQLAGNENQRIGQVEIVTVTGMLAHHSDRWFDSYDDVVARVDAACTGPCHTVVLKVDCRGGLLSGCFEASRAIRARCQAAGKRLVAYVEGCAASGGYAMACAAEHVAAAETALLGSIGVLEPRADTSAADLAMGLRNVFVVSGARKADGHPQKRITDDELAAAQTRVDSLAAVFFTLVAEQRGTTVDAVRALEADCFHGADAIRVGLADSIESFDALLAQVASPGAKGNTMAEESAEETSNDLDEARAALEKAAEGDGDDAERARRALAALDGKTDEPADTTDEPDANAETDRAQVSSRAAAPATVTAPSAAGDLGALVVQLSAKVDKLEGANDATLKQQLMASRPDLPKTVVSLCSGKTYAQAREIVEAIPKPASAQVTAPAATATVRATRGAGQQSGAAVTSALSPHASQLDVAMGLSPKVGGVKRESHALTFEIGEHSPGKRAAALPAGKGTASK